MVNLWSIVTWSISCTVTEIWSLKHWTLAIGSPLIVANAHIQLAIVLLNFRGLLYFAAPGIYIPIYPPSLSLGFADSTHGAHSQPASITVRVWCFEHVVACARNVLLAYLHNFRYKLNVRYLVEILALQIAAKQLQLATWLLLTAYMNLPTPYPTVPSPSLYDVGYRLATIQNVTDRQTTDGQNIVP